MARNKKRYSLYNYWDKQGVAPPYKVHEWKGKKYGKRAQRNHAIYRALNNVQTLKALKILLLRFHEQTFTREHISLLLDEFFQTELPDDYFHRNDLMMAKNIKTCVVMRIANQFVEDGFIQEEVEAVNPPLNAKRHIGWRVTDAAIRRYLDFSKFPRINVVELNLELDVRNMVLNNTHQDYVAVKQWGEDEIPEGLQADMLEKSGLYERITQLETVMIENERLFQTLQKDLTAEKEQSAAYLEEINLLKFEAGDLVIEPELTKEVAAKPTEEGVELANPHIADLKNSLQAASKDHKRNPKEFSKAERKASATFSKKSKETKQDRENREQIEVMLENLKKSKGEAKNE